MITNKYISLPPSQIHLYWEVIKLAIIKTFGIPESVQSSALVAIFKELLAGKCQCFFQCSDDLKNIESILLCEVIVDEWTGQKTLNILSLYSFTTHSFDDWKEVFRAILKKFARKMGCEDEEGRLVITTTSNNPRIQELALFLGFKETSRQYVYIGG